MIDPWMQCGPGGPRGHVPAHGHVSQALASYMLSFISLAFWAAWSISSSYLSSVLPLAFSAILSTFSSLPMASLALPMALSFISLALSCIPMPVSPELGISPDNGHAPPARVAQLDALRGFHT